MKHARPQRTTELLKSVVVEDGHSHVTIEQMTLALGDRAFGLVLLLFALPNLIPSPVGLGPILGIPLMLFSVQLMLAQARPWLPARIARRKFLKSDIRRVISRTERFIRFFESFCTPRLEFATEGIFLRIIAFLIFIQAFLIFFPFPGTGFLPGLSIVVLSIGLIERDGLVVSFGGLINVVALYVSGHVALVGFAWFSEKLF